MDRRIKELTDFTKEKFGLENYYLKRHRLYRDVNIFNKTIYTLSMEWFPSHITIREDDDFNPEGTAVIDLDVNRRKFKSVIFVGEKSFANVFTFPEFDQDSVVKWVEQETNLTYESQFKLHTADERKFYFTQCIDGIAISPDGLIEIKADKEGRIIFFSVYGTYPANKQIHTEPYTLSLNQVENVAKEQLKCIHIPLYEQEQFLSIYGMDEIYIRSDQTSIISVEFIENGKSYTEINTILHWDEPIDQPFEREEINLFEEVTAEQAFSCEPAKDSFSISPVEQKQSLMAVKNVLRKEYPTESGEWIVKTLHREQEYIYAVLRTKNQNNFIFQRKMTIMIDVESLEAVNYIDNQPMLEMFDQFQALDQLIITKEEAYQKLKETFELTPYYVYDIKQQQFVLCGKLDSQYGVSGSNGDIIGLDDL